MELLCECNNSDCNRVIEIPFDVAEIIQATPNSVIIADGCSPDPDDTFVSKEDGYSIYTD